MKLVQKILVHMPLGLHARPASTLVRLIRDCKSKVTIAHNGRHANGKSIVELLMLAAKKGATLEVTVEGGDASDVMDIVTTAFDRGLEVTG